MKIEPFEISVPQEVLEDLQERLKRARWPDEEGVGGDQGTNVSYLKELADY